MSTDTSRPLGPGEVFEIVIEDPTDGQQHIFTGATESEAEAAADAYFNPTEENQR